MIKKEGTKWVLYTKDGTKILGRHPSKQKAIEQEIAIKMIKGKKRK